MVNNEKYTKFLKAIVTCVSHGDYAAVKELSNLELENMKNSEQKLRKEIKKKGKKIKRIYKRKITKGKNSNVLCKLFIQ